jgi:hypothetical protein
MRYYHIKLITGAVAIIILLSGLLLFFMHVIQRKSETKFNALLASFKVDMPYSEAEHILNSPSRALTEQKDVEEWGDFKDDKITSECNLHMFLRMDVIPHRFILIYEDKSTHTIRRVSWKYT